jgi:hypothetical protein
MGSSTFTGNIDKVSQVRYYEIGYGITIAGAVSMAFDRFSPSYGTDDGVLVGNTNLRVAYSIDNRATWNGLDQTTTHITDLSNPPTIITPNAIGTPYTVNNGNGGLFCALASFTNTTENPLPVQLASFVGNIFGNSAELQWETVSEVNNYGFNVQRYNSISNDYETIGFVAGKGVPSAYSYKDENVSGSLEYRLEQIDNNGLTSYFGPIMLNPNSVGSDAVPAVFALNQNYPNPFNPSTIINYQLAFDNYTTLKVYNIIGKEVATLVNGFINAGSHKVTFDASNLSAGVYIYKLQSGNNVEVRKLTLMK